MQKEEVILKHNCLQRSESF